MTAFFKFLLIFLAVFYVLRLIGRWLLGSWIRSVQREYGQAQARGASREKKMREGDVKVSGTVTGNRKVNDKIGDYVDFEEVP
jgi:hypothetical protein